MKNIFLMFIGLLSLISAAGQDSKAVVHVDSIGRLNVDSSRLESTDTLEAKAAGRNFGNTWFLILKENKAVNFVAKPEVYPQRPHQSKSNASLFYYLIGICFFLAVYRSLFDNYFKNLFSLFFNLSIRRNQLRDMLMQARLPGLLLNLFFVQVYGLLFYFLINYFFHGEFSQWQMILICTIAIALLYIIKFVLLRTIGWLTGYINELNNYSFIIFLINKLTALVLLPVVMLLAFADSTVFTVGMVLSVIIIICSFLIRYLRGWSVVASRMKLSVIHFITYVVAIELLPLAVLYKFATNYLSSSL